MNISVAHRNAAENIETAEARAIKRDTASDHNNRSRTPKSVNTYVDRRSSDPDHS